MGLCAVLLVITPSLSGHASVQSPVWAFLPADIAHVAGAAVWVGGVALLAFALPAATRCLEPAERTGLLADALGRFSPIALGCVIALAIGGAIAAYIDVRTLSALFQSTYGRLLLIKTAFFLGLLVAGWNQRSRIIPGLTSLRARFESPGAIGLGARRTLRTELVMMAGALAATAILVAYAPPIDAANGPFSTSATLGAATLEMTVEPARVGPNTIHLYLIDAKTGQPYTATKELTVQARLPQKGIGPLTLRVSRAGPGHYIATGAALDPKANGRSRSPTGSPNSNRPRTPSPCRSDDRAAGADSAGDLHRAARARALPGERRLRRALEGSPRPLRRLLPSTPMLARGFGVAVRGTVRGRAPPLRPC